MVCLLKKMNIIKTQAELTESVIAIRANAIKKTRPY
jgi:hypothetical protein